MGGRGGRAAPHWTSLAKRPSFLSLFFLPYLVGPPEFPFSRCRHPLGALRLASPAPRTVEGSGVVQRVEIGGHLVHSADQLAKGASTCGQGREPLLAW